MLFLSNDQSARFQFVFFDSGQIYDPTVLATPADVLVTITRGDVGSGPVIDGPYSYMFQPATPLSSNYFEKTSNSEFIFNYTVPTNLYEGVYTANAQTVGPSGILQAQCYFQVRQSTTNLSPQIAMSEKNAIINYKPTYEQLNSANTNTILLIGHADNIGINVPVKIKSIQHAIDLIGADNNSPLLRGVFDAYSCGARDIIICAAAPMYEYVANVNNRNTPTEAFSYFNATPNSETFYEKYYERLEQTYSLISDLDFVDIVVPLETSIIKTGSIDFVTQLANYCSSFHNNTGYVQIGVIGSRTGGISSSDVNLILNNSVLSNKLTTYNGSEISSDIGRYVIPVYGEAIFKHRQLYYSYDSSIAAAMAGMLSSNSFNKALIRRNIPSALSIYGADLSHSEYLSLDAIGINTIYRGKKRNRSVPYEVYLTNEYTLSAENSVYNKASQIRLVAYVVSQIKNYADTAIGKFNYDTVVTSVTRMMQDLKNASSIVDFSLRAEVDPDEKGKIIFYIELTCSVGLKKIGFGISAGPGA